MKKNNHVLETFDVPLYPSRFGVLFTNKPENYIEDYFPNRHGSNLIFFGHTAIVEEEVDDLGHRCVIVCFNTECEFNRLTHEVISHEVMHAAHDILSHAGLRLTDSSEEAYAYLTGWLITKVYEVAHENNIKIHLKKR